MKWVKIGLWNWLLVLAINNAIIYTFLGYPELPLKRIMEKVFFKENVLCKNLNYSSEGFELPGKSIGVSFGELSHMEV